MPMSHDDKAAKMPALRELLERAQAKLTPPAAAAMPMVVAVSPEAAAVDTQVVALASAEIAAEAIRGPVPTSHPIRV